MKPTEILSSEHRVIEVMLSVLEKMVAQTTRDGRLDKDDANTAVTFIKTFADTCHHGKEEGQLFPAMEAKGVPREYGPIGVMLNDHEIGRQFVRQMAAHIDAASEGDPQAVQAFCDGATGYVQLLRAHIHKEDHILFPMAQRILSVQDQDELLRRFDTVEHEHIGDGVHEHFLNVAQTLATKYGVASEAITALQTGGSCGCGHHSAPKH